MMILAWYYTYHATSLASVKRFKSWTNWPRKEDRFFSSFGSADMWKS